MWQLDGLPFRGFGRHPPVLTGCLFVASVGTLPFPCDDCRVGIDQYWRTRTLAEAQEQGYSHLLVTCQGLRENNRPAR
jgi:hypothetical protein